MFSVKTLLAPFRMPSIEPFAVVNCIGRFKAAGSAGSGLHASIVTTAALGGGVVKLAMSPAVWPWLGWVWSKPSWKRMDACGGWAGAIWNSVFCPLIGPETVPAFEENWAGAVDKSLL